MISFKTYRDSTGQVEVRALRWNGSIHDAEDIESLFKGRLRLEFMGCFTGNLLLHCGGRMCKIIRPGDYIVDAPLTGLFSLTPEEFHGSYTKQK